MEIKITQSQHPHILELVKTKTLQEVGDFYGVSRERIRQILVKNGMKTPSKYILSPCSTPNCPRTVKHRFNKIPLCNVCYLVFKYRNTHILKKVQKRKFDPQVMCINHPDKKAEAKGLCNNCKQRKYYRTHPEYRENMSKRNKTPEAKLYFKKYFSDPVIKKRLNQRKRIYQKNTTNFTFLQKYFLGINKANSRSFGHC